MKVIKTLVAAALAVCLVTACVSTKEPAAPEAAVAAAPAAEPAPGPGEPGSTTEDGGILYEGFEGEFANDVWSAINSQWTNDPVWSATMCGVEETENATEGERALMAAFRFNGNANKEVNSINRAPYVNQPSNLVDMTGAKSVKMDIFNDSDLTVHLSFVLATGDGWSWNRASRVDVKPGMNEGLEWKLERDPMYGDADLSFKDLDKVKSCILDLFGGPDDKGESGTLYIDNIRFFK